MWGGERERERERKRERERGMMVNTQYVTSCHVSAIVTIVKASQMSPPSGFLA